MNIIDEIVDFVSPYLQGIAEAFKAFMEKVKGIINIIIAKIVDFKNQIFNWIKNHPLIKGRHIPFLTRREDFKEMLKNAPTRKIEGLFEGIYDDQTDEITDLQYIAADELDEKTEEVLGNEDLVVLT
jgi:hypothetical protein